MKFSERAGLPLFFEKNKIAATITIISTIASITTIINSGEIPKMELFTSTAEETIIGGAGNLLTTLSEIKLFAVYFVKFSLSP